MEYRVWNPFRSKLAAAIIGGVENVWVKPGARVLYLGAASGTSVSHVSDMVGPVRRPSILPSHLHKSPSRFYLPQPLILCPAPLFECAARNGVRC